MLNTNTIESTVALLPVLENKPKLSVVPSSPLAILATSLNDRVIFNLVTLPDTAGECQTQDIVNLINNSSNDETGEHAKLIDECSYAVGNVVKRNIYLTRNIALPLIERYTEELNKRVGETTGMVGLNLNITTDKKSNILTDSDLKNSAEKFKSTIFNTAKMPRLHGDELSLGELEQLLSTGNKSFDEHIYGWYTSNNLRNNLVNLYHNVFFKDANTPDMFSKYIRHDNYEDAILGLLLTWGLKRKVQENIELSGADYDSRMDAAAAYFSHAVFRAIDLFERNVRSRKMILVYPPSNKHLNFDENGGHNIIVDESSYNDFLSKGGTPEIVFGAYLTDRKTDGQSLLDNKKMYQDAYYRAFNQSKLLKSNRVLVVIKNAFQKFSFDIINDLQDTLADKNEADNGNSEYNSISLAEQNFSLPVKAFIDKISIGNIDNLYPLVRHFVCSIYLKDTSVEDILLRMDVIDPEQKQDVNQVAIAATSDLIVDWLMDQVTFEQGALQLDKPY